MPALQTALRSLRLLLCGLAFVPTLAGAQAPKDEDDPKKISNDQPTRPLQMPAATNEVREAFDDFDRFKRRGAWERATKALYAIPEAQASRFVDGPDNFIIPVARKRHAVLAGLSPEGLAAYRLFYDADAKKLLDAAEGNAEQANLEKLFSNYFLTTVGDNAADRLGDLYFEAGRFDRAADCFLVVLRDRTDSDLAPALMATKAAIALAKAGRWAECRELRSEVAERYPAEVVTIGGKKAKAVEHLAKIAAAAGAAKTPDASAAGEKAPPTLAGAIAPAWQFRFGATVTAGMTPPEVVQWDANPLSGAVPRVAIEGDKLFANYLGYVLAVDLTTGKLLWRSASFHNLDVSAMTDQNRMIDPSRYAIAAAPGFVYSMGRDLKDMNMMATATLICRRADNGEVVWQSPDTADLAGLDLVGLPIVAQNTLLLVGKSAMNNNGQDNLARQYVMALRPHDGKLLWKTEVGTFREAQQRYFYYGMRDNSPQPRLAFLAGSVFLDTHVGVLARLDIESGRMEWGYGYPTDPVQGQSRFFYRMQPQDPVPMGAPPLAIDDALLIKGAKSELLVILDPGRMKVVWDRPLAKGSRILGVDEGSIYLGGPDLGAIDRKTRKLRWSTPLPGGSEDGRILARPDGIWQLTPRGVYEVDPGSGRVRHIYRGEDRGASGGDLVLTDRYLLTISNQTISAYPRTGAEVVERAAAGTATGTGAGAMPASSKARGSDD